MRLAPETLEPGSDARVELAWTVITPTTRPLALFVHLLGPDNELIGARDSYPGNGRTSTTIWRPGATWVDQYQVPVDAQAGEWSPALVRVELGLYDPATGERLPVYVLPAGGELDPPILATGKLSPPRRAAAALPGVLVSFAGALQLEAVSYPVEANQDRPLPIQFSWSILQPLPCDCQLFLQVVAPGGAQPVAQVDEPVLKGRYPARLWAPGEFLLDAHSIALPATMPPGEYDLVLGLYDRLSLERLAADSAQTPTRPDSYVFGSLLVK